MPPLRNGLRRFAAMVGLSVWWSPMTLHSRIESPPSTVDLTRFVSEAPIIFRGVVLNVSVTEGRQLPLAAVAQLRVQRWYRGEGGSEATVYYQTGFRIPGHDCIDLKPGGHWLIFAAQQNGRLKFIDDCYAAVAVSPEMASTHDPLNVFAQIGADFAAGLGDSEKAGRIVSLQRLGGLRTALSLPAIHRVIDHGDLEEKDWVTYAALRSGDTTVLSRVREMFARADSDVPRYYLAWELGQLRDKSAILGLIEIVTASPYPESRKFALAALGNNLKASEALPAIAARLSDSDPGVRFVALTAMGVVTGRTVCSLPLRFTDDMVNPKISECLDWWNEAGNQNPLPAK